MVANNNVICDNIVAYNSYIFCQAQNAEAS